MIAFLAISTATLVLPSSASLTCVLSQVLGGAATPNIVAAPVSRLLLQRIADCVTDLLEGGLNSRYVVNGVQKHEVVDQTVVTSCGHYYTGLLEFACVCFAFVPKRIILRSDDERRRQALEFA